MAKSDTRTKPVDELTEAEAEAELQRLAEEIAGHDRRYFEQDKPSISDAAYDALRARNTAIEARFPKLRRADSPTGRVSGAPSAKFATARHAVPMLSLEKAFTHEDVRAFIDQVRRFLGLSVDAAVALTRLRYPECVAWRVRADLRAPDGVLGANLARSRARRALADLGDPGSGCAY